MKQSARKLTDCQFGTFFGHAAVRGYDEGGRLIVRPVLWIDRGWHVGTEHRSGDAVLSRHRPADFVLDLPVLESDISRQEATARVKARLRPYPASSDSPTPSA